MLYPLKSTALACARAGLASYIATKRLGFRSADGRRSAAGAVDDRPTGEVLLPARGLGVAPDEQAVQGLGIVPRLHLRAHLMHAGDDGAPVSAGSVMHRTLDVLRWAHTGALLQDHVGNDARIRRAPGLHERDAVAVVANGVLPERQLLRRPARAGRLDDAAGAVVPAGHGVAQLVRRLLVASRNGVRADPQVELDPAVLGGHLGRATQDLLLRALEDPGRPLEVLRLEVDIVAGRHHDLHGRVRIAAVPDLEDDPVEGVAPVDVADLLELGLAYHRCPTVGHRRRQGRGGLCRERRTRRMGSNRRSAGLRSHRRHRRRHTRGHGGHRGLARRVVRKERAERIVDDRRRHRRRPRGERRRGQRVSAVDILTEASTSRHARVGEGVDDTVVQDAHRVVHRDARARRSRGGRTDDTHLHEDRLDVDHDLDLGPGLGLGLGARARLRQGLVARVVGAVSVAGRGGRLAERVGEFPVRMALRAHGVDVQDLDATVALAGPRVANPTQAVVLLVLELHVVITDARVPDGSGRVGHHALPG